MEKFISSKGRKLIGWDEILEGGLAPNATVMSWRGVEGAIAAAKAGHDTVLSPAPDLYFDHWQSPGDTSPGRSNTLSLKDVYLFNPLPEGIEPEQRKHVLGLQANLWAEMMRSEARHARDPLCARNAGRAGSESPREPRSRTVRRWLRAVARGRCTVAG
jgi:hexosaminidase